MDLLGHVGQVEVRGEGSCQQHDRLEVLIRQEGVQPPGGLGVGPIPQCLGETADLLDEVEQLGSDLTDERVPEHPAEHPDVGSQCAVVVEQCGIGSHGAQGIPPTVVCADRAW